MLFVAFAAVLPARAFEAIAVAQGVLVLSQAIGDFGLSQAAVTALPAAAATGGRPSAPLFAGAAVVFGFGAAGAVLLTSASALLLDGAPASATLLIAPAAGMAVVGAGADGLLRARGRFGRPLVLVSISRLSAFAAVPVAAASDSADSAAFAVSVATLVGTLPAAAVLLREARCSPEPAIAWFARAAAPLGISQILVVGSARINTLVLASVGRVRDAAAFESAWRLYQLVQYIGGGIASAVGPLLAHAVGGGSAPMARRLALRLIGGLGGAGIAVAAAGWALAPAIAESLFPGQADLVRPALRALAVTVPPALAATVAQVALATLPRTRRWIPVAHALGAALNIAGLALFARSEGVTTVTIWCAAGIAVTSCWLIAAALRATRAPR